MSDFQRNTEVSKDERPKFYEASSNGEPSVNESDLALYQAEDAVVPGRDSNRHQKVLNYA